MAHILCIETSTDLCSVSVSHKSDVLITRIIEEGKRHSSELTTLIQGALGASQLEMSDLSAVAISDGPGSYTGLRVGASTAKGLCLALGIPLLAISTLEVLAFEHMDQGCVVATIDARRMEVYAAIYHKSHLIKDVHSLIWTESSVSELVKKYTDVLICGNGALKAQDLLLRYPSISFVHTDPLASMLVPLAWNSFSNGFFADIAYHSPFYFKKPNITSPKRLI